MLLEELPSCAPGFTIRHHPGEPFPTSYFVSHHKPRSARVLGGTFVEEVEGSFESVEDEDVSTHDIREDDIRSYIMKMVPMSKPAQGGTGGEEHQENRRWTDHIPCPIAHRFPMGRPSAYQACFRLSEVQEVQVDEAVVVCFSLKPTPRSQRPKREQPKFAVGLTLKS